MKICGYYATYVARIFWALPVLMAFGTHAAFAQTAASGALVTSASGSLTRTAPEGGRDVEPFVRLRDGDHISLDRNARLRLVYLANGRQETWQGSGKLLIGNDASKAGNGLESQVTQLPNVLVRQLSKTPGTEGQARAGMTRLRSVASSEQLSKLENGYRQMRSQSSPDDVTPEMYLFSGYFELREMDRLDQAIADLKTRLPFNPDAERLIAHYQRAVREVRTPVTTPNGS